MLVGLALSCVLGSADPSCAVSPRPVLNQRDVDASGGHWMVSCWARRGEQLAGMISEGSADECEMQAMADGDILVAWPSFGPGKPIDPLNAWTLSHRQAPGHTPPMVTSPDPALSTNTFFTVIPALTTTDPASPFTVLTFVRLLKEADNYPSTSPHKEIMRDPTSFIYASSSHRPPSAAQDAPLAKHDQVCSRSTSICVTMTECYPVTGTRCNQYGSRQECRPRTRRRSGCHRGRQTTGVEQRGLAEHEGPSCFQAPFDSSRQVLGRSRYAHYPSSQTPHADLAPHAS